MAKTKQAAPAVTLQYIPFEKLVFLGDNPDTAANPRTRDEGSETAMAEAIRKDPTFYENRPTLVNFTKGLYCVYAGDLRAHAAHHKLGWALIPCNVEADVPLEIQAKRMILDNTHFAGWDTDVLAEWKFEPEELEEMGVWLADDAEGGIEAGEINAEGREALEPGKSRDLGGGQLQARFGVPPFSVLDTRQGYWQERKRHWLSLGIKSELGRGGGMTFNLPVSAVQKLSKINRGLPA